MNALISATAIVAISGTSFGLGESIDQSNIPIFTTATPGVTITKRPMDALTPTGATTVIYDSLSGGAGYVASPPATGILGFEDYGSTLSPSGPPNGSPSTATDTVPLAAFDFAGGHDNGSMGQVVDGTLFFVFFYNDFSTADSFGVTLPTAGSYLWTITIDNPPGSVHIPTEGIAAMYANNNPNLGPITSGRWFLSDVGANPLVGHNDTFADAGSFEYGDPNDPNVPDSDIRAIGYNFALTVPTPGATALLGLTGIAALRRRR